MARQFIITAAVAFAVAANAAAAGNRSAVEYDSVNVGGESSKQGLALVDAISSGNWKRAESILDGGVVGIDDVICIRKSCTDADYLKFGGGGSEGELGDTFRIATSPSDYLSTTPVCVRFTDMVFESPQCRKDATAWMRGEWKIYEASYDARAHLWRNENDCRDWIELYGTPLMVAARLGNKFMVGKLLAKGANPNVFIRAGGFRYSYSLWPHGMNLIGVTRPWLCALIDAYATCEGRNERGAAECASMLLDAGAYFPNQTRDDYGRTALWDAAILASPAFIETCVSRFGMNVNEADNLGRTVAEYLAGAGRNAGKYSGAVSASLQKLRQLGANTPGAVPSAPRPMDDGLPPAAQEGFASPTPSAPPQEFRQPVPSSFGARTQRRRTDNSAEIARLDRRLFALRIELEKAEANEDMAILQGTGVAMPSARVSHIRQEISKIEARIARLQD